MGYVYDSKCVLLILLQILWEETDEEHILSYEEVGKRIFDIYEPKRVISGRAARVRFVRKYVEELHEFCSYKGRNDQKYYHKDLRSETV